MAIWLLIICIGTYSTYRDCRGQARDPVPAHHTHCISALLNMFIWAYGHIDIPSVYLNLHAQITLVLF